jgi:protein ImuA
MAGKRDLQALRRRIGALAAVAPEATEGTITLGEAAIDGALPEGGLALGAVHELLPASHGDFAAALGFGFGLLARLTQTSPRPVLWVVPSRDASRHGIAYPIGLAAFGCDPGRLVHLSAGTAQDVLWALEEGLASAALAAVVGLLPANDKAYDFTASRRLSLRAAASGVTALIIRHHASADNPTAALTRWSIAARPSAPLRRRGPSLPGVGPPRWQASLVRCKRGRPRHWLVEWNHETLSFRLAASLADRAPAVAEPAARRGWRIAS